jgi:glycyl-tRNA synthetase beta chain
MKNLLVELFVEELPPKALKTLGQAFAAAFAEACKRQDLTPGAPVTPGAPERLGFPMAPRTWADEASAQLARRRGEAQ